MYSWLPPPHDFLTGVGVGRSLHVGFGLFARVGQAGDTPGFPLTAKQKLHAVFVHVVSCAHMAESGQSSPETVEVLSQCPDNYPMVMG